MPTKKKQKKNKILSKKIAIALIAIIVIFSLLFVASKTFGKVTLSKATDAFTSLSAEIGTFPYEVQSNSVDDIVPFGSGVAVLKTDSVDVLSSSGKLLQSVHHNYAEPSLDIKNDRAILFDRGSTRYMVLSKTQVLLEERQTTDKILDACMASDGKFAIAVTAGNVKSVLYVYDTSFEEMFIWRCVSEYITDIDFSDNGKKIAVTVTGVENAKPYSKLIMFDFKKDKVLSQKEFDSMMLFSVNMSGKVTTVVSDNYMCSLENGTEKTEEKQFSGDVLKNFSFEESGKSIALLLTYGNERAVKLCGYDKKGKSDFEVSLDEKTIAVSRSKQYICVLTGNGILTYNNSGVLVNEIPTKESVRDICVSGRTLYVLYSDRIEKYSAS